MRRFLIHIGPHKTGTTYIQMRLDAARDLLRAAGVLFPVVWRAAGAIPSHLGFFERIRNRQIVTLRREIADLPDDRLVVISSEDLQYLDAQEVAALADVLATPEVTIVYYCRRWSGLLPSIWQERTKHGGYQSLPDFMRMMTQQATQSPLVNFGLVVDRYVAAFGEARVRLVSYDEVIGSGADLADHFASTFLPPLPAPLPPAAVSNPNASMGPIPIEMVRSLNELHCRRGAEPTNRISAWVLGKAATPDISAIHVAMSLMPGLEIFADDLPPFAQLHRELFSRLGRMLAPPIADNRLFRPQVSDIAYVQPHYRADPAISQRLEALYRGFLDAN